LSDTHTQIALWMVGAAAAAATIGSLSVGLRAQVAAPVSMTDMTSAAPVEGHAAAHASPGLPSGLSLLPLVQDAAAGTTSAMASGSGPEAAVVEPSVDAGAPLAQVAFESGQTSLSPKAKALLLDIAAGVKQMDGASLVLSGFHDTAGSPEVNARLAKERAQAVRDELVAKGMPAERIKLQKPQVMVGDSDPALARRVDIGLLR
jgi:outer membrane protein OmpA-like peptidoglycan-associated protein